MMTERLRNLISGRDAASRSANDELEILKNHLRVIYRRQGEQSYRVLAAQTGLSPATISRIFNATKPPKWNNLRRVLDALGVAQTEQDGIWHPLWSNAQNKIKPLSKATSLSDKPDTPRDPQKTVCRWCGVEVEAAQADVHAWWHKDLTERLTRIDGLLSAIEHRIRRLPLGVSSPASQGSPATTAQTPPTDGPGPRQVATDKRKRGGARL